MDWKHTSQRGEHNLNLRESRASTLANVLSEDNAEFYKIMWKISVALSNKSYDYSQ